MTSFLNSLRRPLPAAEPPMHTHETMLIEHLRRDAEERHAQRRWERRMGR